MRWRGLLAVLAALLAACGTTVSVRSQAARSTGDQGLGPAGTPSSSSASSAAGGGGSAGGSPGSVAGGSAAAGGAAGGAAGAVGSSGSSGSSGGGSPSTALPANPGGLAVSGPGWDAHHVYVGFTNQSDVDTVAHGLGISLDPGNVQGDIDAIVGDLNHHGGLLGRQVVAVVHDNSTAALLADPNSGVQANCTYFAEDHRVVAVVNLVSLIDTDAFRACMAKAHTPIFSLSVQPIDDRSLQQFAPYLYSGVVDSFDRISRPWLRELTSQGYFDGWDTGNGGPGKGAVKVGVVYPDSATGTRILSSVSALLAAAGHPVVASFAEPDNSTNGESSAVLHFAAVGVTHVVTVTGPFKFMTQAETQHYRPRYAVTSYGALQPSMANGPARQLVGSLGIGWVPSLDVNQGQEPGGEPGAAACRRTMNAGGQPLTGRFAQVVAYALCDGFGLTVEAAIASHGLDAASLRAGVLRIGPAFPTAVSFSSGLVNGRFELPGSARDLAFDTGCQCYTYRGGAFSL